MKHILHTRWTRIALSASLASTLSVINPAFAQPDTARARQVFAEVNKQLLTLDKVSFVVKRPDVAYKSEARAWLDAGSVSKVETTEKDDSGNVVTEYYYTRGELVFVYQSVMGFSDSGNSKKMATTSEERLYFSEGKMFKWLSGMGSDKTDNASGNREFSDEAKSRLAVSALLTKSATNAYARQPGARLPR